MKWTTKTVLEGTDGTYGEMDEDISSSSHQRKNHPVSLQKANEDYASNDDYSSSSHDKNTQTTDYGEAPSANNNNNTEQKTNRKARAFQMHCLLCELFRDRYAARIINHRARRCATMTKPCARAFEHIRRPLVAIVQSNYPGRSSAARSCKVGTYLTPVQSSCRNITWAST